jgi:hypothetical protein
MSGRSGYANPEMLHPKGALVERLPMGPALGWIILQNVVPAYVAPLVIASTISRAIPNRVTGRALAHAAVTTIPVSSALTALVVTLVLWRLSNRASTTSRSLIRTAAISAVGSALLAAGISALLVRNNYFDSRLFADAIPTAVLGGAISAIQNVRFLRRRKAELPVGMGL